MRASISGGKQNIDDQAGSNLNQYSQFVSKATDKAAAKETILDQVRGNFRDFLAKRKPGQPFFYSFNPTNTHRKWTRGSGKALWGLDPDELKGKLPPVLPDTDVIREDMADYLGEAMAFDAACTVLIAELEKLGELDNTIVVISGDHGAPGFPRGKCNMHDFGSRVLLAIRWPKHIASGRDVNRPVSLIDLAPTFLAAAGLKSQDDPNGQNLLPGIAPGSDDSKLRPWVLIGRELHAHTSRKDNLPYPVRAIRTTDHLYIINFKPDRWPSGNPRTIPSGKIPSFDQLANNTYAAFPDIDASPTKAWMVEHRNDENVIPLLDFAWNKRPAEELYDLRKDPFQTNNLAGNPEYEPVRKKLRTELIGELKANKDPRLTNDAFDQAPYLSKKTRRKNSK